MQTNFILIKIFFIYKIEGGNMYYGYIINDRYVIRKTIGTGGSSTVFLAYDNKLDKLWAVKLCNTLCDNEILALKSINNYAFPRVIDICIQDGLTFLVMDYIEGDTLTSYLKSHKESEEQILLWMAKIAYALSYLHHLNPVLIYMDLKPDNIIITKSKDIRLVDLGSIYVCDNIYVNKLSGTRYYSSQESLNGLVDINSDVYTLGMTMYEIFNNSKKEYRDKSGNLRLRKRNKHISRFTEYIINRCTHKNVSRRYHSMEDLLIDLKQKNPVRKVMTRIKYDFNRLIYKFIDIVFKVMLCLGVIISALYFSSLNDLRLLFAASVLLLIFLLSCFSTTTYTFETEKEILKSSATKFIISALILFICIPPLNADASSCEPLLVTLYDEYNRKLLVRSGCTLELDHDLLFSIPLKELPESKSTIIIKATSSEYEREYILSCIPSYDTNK